MDGWAGRPVVFLGTKPRDADSTSHEALTPKQISTNVAVNTSSLAGVTHLVLSWPVTHWGTSVQTFRHQGKRRLGSDTLRWSSSCDYKLTLSHRPSPGLTRPDRQIDGRTDRDMVRLKTERQTGSACGSCAERLTNIRQWMDRQRITASLLWYGLLCWEQQECVNVPWCSGLACTSIVCVGIFRSNR